MCFGANQFALYLISTLVGVDEQYVAVIGEKIAGTHQFHPEPGFFVSQGPGTTENSHGRILGNDDDFQGPRFAEYEGGPNARRTLRGMVAVVQ